MEESTHGHVSDLQETLEPDVSTDDRTVTQAMESETSADCVTMDDIHISGAEGKKDEKSAILESEKSTLVNEGGVQEGIAESTKERDKVCLEEESSQQPEPEDDIDKVQEHTQHEVEDHPEENREHTQNQSVHADDTKNTEGYEADDDTERTKEHVKRQPQDDITEIKKSEQRQPEDDTEDIKENAQYQSDEEIEEIEDGVDVDDMISAETAEEDRLPPLKSKAPKIGTARYYTMRSMYRGKDQDRIRAKSLAPVNEMKPDVKEIADVKLPVLELETNVNPTSSKFPSGLSTSYIDNYKTLLKLRGFKFEDVFTHNRNKAERSMLRDTGRRRQQKMLEMSKNKRKRHLGVKSEPQSQTSAENSDADDMPSVGSTGSVFSSVAKIDDNTDREESDLERKLHDMMNTYSDTPGYRKKKTTTGRKLGNVVSSHRLSQLLESNQPLRMENFYNYYP